VLEVIEIVVLFGLIETNESESAVAGDDDVAGEDPALDQIVAEFGPGWLAHRPFPKRPLFGSSHRPPRGHWWRTGMEPSS
jgi:hypothetical protein